MEAALLGYTPSPAASRLARPLFDIGVSAGKPQPAEHAAHQWLDLNRHLIDHPQQTFFVRVNGDSMQGAGILDGDMLIVDRALSATHGDVVVAIVEGELTVKRLNLSRGECWLMPENPDYTPIQLLPEMAFEVWGVVTSAIHSFR